MTLYEPLHHTFMRIGEAGLPAHVCAEGVGCVILFTTIAPSLSPE